MNRDKQLERSAGDVPALGFVDCPYVAGLATDLVRCPDRVDGVCRPTCPTCGGMGAVRLYLYSNRRLGNVA